MIHHVFANRSNIGDWLSARGIQSLLRPLEVTEHLCDEPFVDETLTRLAQATSDDLIVIGGGGLFMDYFEPFWAGFQAIAARVPFCIWGVGYCDLKLEKSLPSPSLLENIVGQSSLCVVRDELTRKYLTSCELPDPVICPSLTVLSRPQKNGFGLLHVDNYSTAGTAAYEAMCEAGLQFAARSGRKYRATNNHIKSGSEQELNATLALYADSDLVLSSGLHGCVIAVATGRKVLAVSGDYKIEAFMKTAGLSDWVCGIDELAMITERLEALQEQPERPEFISAARVANQTVADAVKAIYEKAPASLTCETQRPKKDLIYA